MVKIKTKNMEFSYDNPWIQISDIPPLWKKVWIWVWTPHRRLKARIKRYYKATLLWQSWKKWLTGVFIGFCGGLVAAWAFFYGVAQILY
jgi:hypothetical protein